MKEISVSVPKVDNEEKISGKAAYVNDIGLPGALYAKTYRSTIVSGEIRSINLPDLPEGYFNVDFRDIPGQNGVHMILDDWPVFVEKKVNYIGEPIGLIVGPDKATVLSLIRQISIEYSELPPIADEKNTMVRYHYEKGDPRKAFLLADRIIEAHYETGYQEQAYLEPQGMIGYYENDQIVLIGSIQCPYYVKNAVIKVMGCSPDKIRVIQPVVGGAFGGKEEFPSVLGSQVAVAVKKAQKPVRLIYEREEDILVTTKRHPSKIFLKAALSEEGKVVGISSNILLNGGAFQGLSNVVLSRAMIATTGAYTVEHIDCSGEVYRTNSVPTGAFRGFGAPQIFFAVEMFFQHIAKEIGCDPLEFKLRHLAKQGDSTSTSGTFREPILLKEMVERVKRAANYEEKNKAIPEDGNLHGMGISLFFHGCGFTGSGEATIIKAKVNLEKTNDDEVFLHIAAVDMGQGTKTTMIKVVADTIGIPMEKVHFPYPDTNQVPDSGPTVASRTMMVVGNLIKKAAQKIKKEWVCGQANDVVLQYEQPDWIAWDEEHFHGDAYPAYSWGADIVEVSVDPSSYQVKVEGEWSIYDIGKPIDERIVLGQAEGGITQGLAYGYLENMQIEKGMIRQRNLTDYIIPTSVDVGNYHTEWIENPSEAGPYGAKGAGETTLIGGAPAIAMAIENAINRRVYKIPVTPESILELIEHGKR